MSDPNLPDIAIGGGVVGGVWVVVRLLGALFGWEERRAERKAKQLEAEGAELDQGWRAYRMVLEAQIAQQNARIAEVEKRDRQREEENITLRQVLQVVASELWLRDPANHALEMAQRLLRSTFGIPASVPKDMAERLDEIDRQTGRAPMHNKIEHP